MTKHTPGPWVAICDDETGPREIGDDGLRFWTIDAPRGESHIYRGGVALVFASRLKNGITIEERDANARLIAAAPDMLEALKFFANWPANLRQDGLSMAFAMAEDAIAKAKGE